MRIRAVIWIACVAACGCTKPAPPVADVRADALRRAQVWIEPAIPIELARLGENPAAPDGFDAGAVVDCRFKAGGISGNSPKFECELDDGRTVKVKYGRENPEVYTEVAATRLLSALGFPADRMYVVAKVRCHGCPDDPFSNLQCMNEEGATLAGCFPHLDYERHEDFDPAVIERPLKGRHIETKKMKGWSWEELARIETAAGGAPRGQVDALRLLAVFLGHWDNKANNQRLLCLDPHGNKDDPCARPLALVQDVGATFGPPKLTLAAWAGTPVWADAATCTVSMKALPYGGSTFPDTRISEAGRVFLAERLRRLTTAQIRALFEGAQLTRYRHADGANRDVDAWVRAFEQKVREIVDRQPCGTDA